MDKKITKEQAEQIAEVAGVKLGDNLTKTIVKNNLSLVQNLTPNIFMTEILDTINMSKNPFDVFNKIDTKYGKGVRYVSTGIIESTQWKIGALLPSLDGSNNTTKVNKIPDYEDFSTSNFESSFGTIWNMIDLLDYFKNAENFATFLNKLKAVHDLSYQNESINSWLYLLGNSNVSLPQYLKTELDKSKSKIVNTIDLGQKDNYKDVFTEIVKTAKDMGCEGKTLTSKYNIGFANGSGEKLNKSIPSEDLVYICSINDRLKFSQELATIYHQTFYQGENKFFKVIEADIPEGTAYLLDKEALRKHYKVSDFIVDKWIDGSTTANLIVLSYLGVFKYANGVKLTFTIRQN